MGIPPPGIPWPKSLTSVPPIFLLIVIHSCTISDFLPVCVCPCLHGVGIACLYFIPRLNSACFGE